MLGRFGERRDNPSLLDRNYTGGWLVLATLVALGVFAGAVWSRSRLIETVAVADDAVDSHETDDR
jgi:hypothetical protein